MGKNSHWEHRVDKQSLSQSQRRGVIESKVYWRSLCLQFSAAERSLAYSAMIFMIFVCCSSSSICHLLPGQSRSSLVRFWVRLGSVLVSGSWQLEGRRIFCLTVLFFLMPSSLKFCFFLWQSESLSPSSILLLLFVQHLVLCVCIVISFFLDVLISVVLPGHGLWLCTLFW